MPNDTATPTQITNINQLRRPAQTEQLPSVQMGFDTLQGFELMQRGAKLLASSTLVPQQYQSNLANCVIALNMANRIGADPLLVMQNLYIVHGRPGWSAKFLIASFNQCGRFSAIRFEWSGKRDTDDWGCRAWAIEKDTQQKIEGPLITLKLSKAEGWYDKKGSKWQTIPELMLQYRAAAWMVNTHAPEISMGLNTAEELGDTFNAAQGGGGLYTVTTDELKQESATATLTEPAAIVNAETGETTSLLDDVKRICANAITIADSETAYLRLDDARILLDEMLPGNRAAAIAEIDKAVDLIKGRK